MGIFKGGALRLFQTFLYALEFCCAAVCIGVFSYFLAVLADRDTGIATQWKAVEGISGAAVLYLIFAVLLTCCLGGISIFAFIAIALDVCFVGGMIAIAVLTRHGASKCSGFVRTPLGDGPATTDSSGYGNFGTGQNENLTYAVSLRTACKLNTAVFAVSIIAAFLFLITAGLQVALVRHHKKEKRYGPSPSNNYTSGFGKKKFWQRKPKDTTIRDTELGAGGLAAPGPDMRPSHETGLTGSTVGNTGTFDKTVHEPAGAHTGYYTQPQGAGVNPYGYDARTTGTATNY
ncbi:hypothetical protein DOTSEDRAFT_67657 [Dothistroma septosporum NZE10]|uniref:MARVEL domain-containing protein n=1 Tax=Dothistroma septosporum (strain NZE10 / CBS 128990) TaxID=675120 RepID=N1PYV1_DOTSN|nr:hypothetical protein DOTSEDRAFT_67657 [Dothistroma septosporum NZE10]